MGEWIEVLGAGFRFPCTLGDLDGLAAPGGPERGPPTHHHVEQGYLAHRNTHNHLPAP